MFYCRDGNTINVYLNIIIKQNYKLYHVLITSLTLRFSSLTYFFSGRMLEWVYSEFNNTVVNLYLENFISRSGSNNI